MPHRRYTDPIITVAIVEDDAALRDPLALIVDGSSGLVCAGAFEDAESLLASSLEALDVILLDLGLPGMSGAEALGPIRARWPRADVLVLTVYRDEEHVFEALCAGASGYLVKNTPPAQLIEAIQELYEGGAPMSASIARQVVQFFRRPEYQDDALTEREQEVLQILMEGKTNRQIAEELFISENTVAFHLKQIYDKLHVHSRTEAVAKALKRRRRRS